MTDLHDDGEVQNPGALPVLVDSLDDVSVAFDGPKFLNPRAVAVRCPEMDNYWRCKWLLSRCYGKGRSYSVAVRRAIDSLCARYSE